MEVCSVEDAVSFLFKIITSVLSVQVVPGAEVFRREPMISPNMVCTVFNRTPPSLAPEELHPRGRLNMPLGRTSSKKRRMSPKEVEEEEADACMKEVYQIDKLRTSEKYIDFCFALFGESEFRSCFNLIPNKTLKYEYVVWQYNKNLAP